MQLELTCNPEQSAALLSLMANEGRLRVLELISKHEWDVASLAAAVDLSQSALSQHLKKMRDAKIVETRRDAQTIYYSCRSEAVTKVLATLTEIFGRSEEIKVAA